jgi:hypothetical protein
VNLGIALALEPPESAATEGTRSMLSPEIASLDHGSAMLNRSAVPNGLQQNSSTQRQQQLPWPTSTSGEYATIAELMGETSRAPNRSRVVSAAMQAYLWTTLAIHQGTPTSHSPP